MSVTQSVGNAGHFDEDGDRGCGWAGKGTMCVTTCSCEVASKNIDDGGPCVHFDGGAKMTADHVVVKSVCESVAASSDGDNSEASEISSDSPGVVIRACSVCTKCHLPDHEVLVSNDGLHHVYVEGSDSREGASSPCGEEMDCNALLDETEEAAVLSGYETPREGLFDPFAPGPEVLACAPKKVMFNKYGLPLRRQLQFDSSSDDDDSDGDEGSSSKFDAEDAKIVESLSLFLIEIVISSQSEEAILPELISPEEPKTPTAVPLLSGIEESCPDAPLRHAFKSRKIDMAICRKLDFSAEVV